MKTEPTKYWTFFCSPAKWEIDKFLQTNLSYDDYMITDWQAPWFKPGQLGVVRVGIDKRTKEQLNGRKRLVPGVYAIIEVTGAARARGGGDQFWIDKPPSEDQRQAVDIRYLRNLLECPLFLDNLKLDPAITDKHLLGGFQAASMPLDPGTFNRIVALAGGDDYVFGNIEPEPCDSLDAIAKLEREYAEASPQVQWVISERIERGAVGAKVKSAMGFKCQICEAIGLAPIGFRKRSGEPYVEAHHVAFVSCLRPGVLVPSNIIAVCANHHRQLHYGNAELIPSTLDEFVFRIDGHEVRVRKVSAAILA